MMPPDPAPGSGKNRGRILLATCGTWGDVQPAISQGLALKEKGHEVLLAAPPEFEARAAEYGIPFVGLGTNITEFLAQFPGAQTLKSEIGFAKFMRREIPLQFAQLGKIMDADFDLVLVFSLMVGAISMAEFFGLPCLWTATTPQLLPSAEHPPVEFKRHNLPRWVNRLLWRQAAFQTNLLILGVINRERKKLGLASVAHVVRHMMGALVLVGTDPALAPVPGDVTCAYRQTGYLDLPNLGGLSPEIEDFLAAGPPPVFVGFGSMPEKARETTEIVARAVRGAGQRLILHRGSGGLGEGVSGDDCLVISGAPHGLLFPRLAAIVHHGGAGTTAMAARSGRPQVVVPHILDQFFWAHRVRLTGLGPSGPHRSRLNPDNLEAALRECLENADYQGRAQDMAQSLAGVQGGRTAAEIVETEFLSG